MTTLPIVLLKIDCFLSEQLAGGHVLHPISIPLASRAGRIGLATFDRNFQCKDLPKFFQYSHAKQRADIANTQVAQNIATV